MTSTILDASEACRRLRITPELLFQYVRRGAKGRTGLKLATVDGANATRFNTSDLDAYDAYLHQPWPSDPGKRAAIPQGVRDYLKVESGGMCLRCGAGAPLQDAHIIEWETSRSNHHHNLVRLCGNCHGLYDAGSISRADIERIKSDAIDRLQKRIIGASRCIWPIVGAPPMVAELLGRSREMSEAVLALRSGETLLISGVGGIGKTQLALHSLRRAHGERPILWVGVDTLSASSSVEDTLLSQALAAGVEIVDGKPRLDDARACVVFDGIERLGQDQDKVGDFLERLLLECSDTLVVVTSQVSLPWLRFQHELKLGPLDSDAAALLLVPQEGVSKSSMEGLLAFAQGHPLTLRILAALMRHFGTADQVVSRLDRLGAAAVAAPRRKEQSERTSLIHCLDLAYSELDSAERRLLWLVASSPGGFRPGLHAIERLVGPDPAAAGAQLQAWNLVEIVLDDGCPQIPAARIAITMLSPIRAFVKFATHRAPPDGMEDLRLAFCQSEADLVTILQVRFLQGGAVELGKALMERELPNAIAAFELAIEHSDESRPYLNAVTGIADATMMMFFMSGRFDMGQAVMRQAAAAAAAAGSLTDAIQFLYQMQILGERASNQAVAAFALTEAERIGTEAEGEAFALLRLLQSSAAEHQGDHISAATLARAAYETLQGIDEPWVRSAGFQLGRALEFSGHPDQALPLYHEALEAAEEESDPINRGSVLHHIGNCEAYAGRWQDAMHAYRSAAEQFVELDAVEFISNALGEAGLVVAQLDPIIGLPGREVIAAGLDDAIDQIGLLMGPAAFDGRNPRVRFRKFGGVVSLALHTENLDLLCATADQMYERFLAPLAQDIDSQADGVKFMVFHIQGMVRLLQFLGFGVAPAGPLSRAEVFVAARLAGNAFAIDPAPASSWLASYLRRMRGMRVETQESLLEIMQLSESEATVRGRGEAMNGAVIADWLEIA